MTTEGDGGYISSLTARPHQLVPPGRPPARWRELEAMVRWVFGSWLRPAECGVRATRMQSGRPQRGDT